MTETERLMEKMFDSAKRHGHQPEPWINLGNDKWSSSCYCQQMMWVKGGDSVSSGGTMQRFPCALCSPDEIFFPLPVPGFSKI